MFQPIETERLVLRPFVPGDAEAMYGNWASDPEVTKFLIWPVHEDVTVSRKVIALWTEALEKGTEIELAIVPKDEGKPIGSISLLPKESDALTEAKPKERLWEMGYCMAKRCWGKGIMTEAARAMLSAAFERGIADRIIAKHDIENPASGRVMQKAGMRYLGIQHNVVNNRGTIDAAVYTIEKNEGKG